MAQTLDVAKVLRTAQSYFPALKPAKDAAYRHARRLLRMPHEADFRVLAGLLRDLDEILVDVGANHGQTIESMRLFQPSVSVVAFEANPVLARTLAHRYAREPRVRIEDRALGQAPGSFTLHVPSYRGFVYDGLASLDETEARNWLGHGTLYAFDERRLATTELHCQVATLDSFALTPAFLKIDVQGLEYDVIIGGVETIERNRPAILLEAFETDPRIESVTASLGYEVFHVESTRAVRGLGPGPNTLLLHPGRPRFASAGEAQT